jgi:hypothetical protein
VATKLEIINTVLGEVGRTDLLAQARIWFDEVYSTVLSFTDWGFITTRATRSCVAGTYKYGLPADFRKLHVLFVNTGSSDSAKLREMALAEFVAKYPRMESLPNSIPVEFTLYDNNLLIGPPPQNSGYVLNLIYTYNPPAIGDGEGPVIPDRWLNCLRYGVRAAAYLHLREAEKAKVQAEVFAAYMKKMQDDDKDVSGDKLELQAYMPNFATIGTEYWKNPFVVGLR